MEKNGQNNEFLQSGQWRKFQESVGRKTFHLENDGFSASIMEHSLPIVGKYLYIPRGPILNENQNSGDKRQNLLTEIIDLAKKENVGWIRIDLANNQILELIKELLEEIRHRRTEYRIMKAPHDMQPKEIFVVDITKAEGQLLEEMKSKTRYNIKLAEKKNVKIIVSSEKEYIDKFYNLVEITSKRQGITSHTKNYYQKMFENIPQENIKLYCAEFEGKIIAANLVIFFGDTAVYLHGASDDHFRSSMAPYLLQWNQILDAKKFGFEKYDFGGVKTAFQNSSWAGITRFKFSFSPNTKSVEFLGSYDIIISPSKYAVYRGLQKVKELAVKIRK